MPELPDKCIHFRIHILEHMTSTSIKIVDRDFYRFSIAASIAVLFASMALFQYVHPLCGLLALLIPVILTIQTGVELRFDRLQYRKFRSILGKRSGEWKKYTPEHVLVVLNKSGSKGIISLYTFQERMIDDVFLELYIMDPGHLKRLFLCASKEVAKIWRIVDHITQHSTLVLETYAPATARR
jgi:hypothetical protein